MQTNPIAPVVLPPSSLPGHSGALPFTHTSGVVERPVSWLEHFDRRHKEARARMLVRQSTAPDSSPFKARKIFVPQVVYTLPPGPHPKTGKRIVYIRPIGPQVGCNARLMIGSVASKYGQTYETVTGPSRLAAVSIARQECFWALRNVFNFSLVKCGRALGNRDHTTALHGIVRHQARIDAGEIAI